MPHRPDGHPPPLKVFLSVRDLAPSCRPCHVTRHDGLVLLAVQPGVPRFEIVKWCVDNLTDAEQNAYRAAYGQPPVDQPIDDWLMEGVTLCHVPESLRTRGAPAVQGQRSGRAWGRAGVGKSAIYLQSTPERALREQAG